MGENVEQGRNADILQSIIDRTEYTDPPQSRIEDLLLQVKEVIEEGGGGGGDVTSVNGKTGEVTLTASDVGAYTTAETGALLGNKQDKTLSASVKIGTETEITVEGAIGEVAAIIPATAATSNKLSTAADTAKEDITATASGSDITLTDAVDARVQGVTVKGHSEVVESVIKSVGDDGFTVTSCGKNVFNPQNVLDCYIDNNSQLVTTAVTVKTVYAECRSNTTYTISKIAGARFVVAVSTAIPAVNGFVTRLDDTHLDASTITVTTTNDARYIVAWVYNSNYDTITAEQMLASVQIEENSTATPYEPYKGTAATITTGLPLRSTLDGTVYDELTNEKVVTRCEVVNDEVVPLATPVTTPLSDAEKAAFAEFRTFDGSTNVTATDNPLMSMVYVKNTDNGKALADVDDRIEETFTAAEKAKLAGIATGATANTVISTTCTLTVAGWTGAAAPYTQTVNVTGILATDVATCDVSVSSTVATGLDEIDDWALISKIESGAGTLTFSCYEDKPTTELNVNVKVVR